MKSICLLLLIVFFFPVWASPVSGFPGAVPYNTQREQATDLVYKGKVLLPHEVRKLTKEKGIKSEDLNPDGTSVIWRNSKQQLGVSEVLWEENNASSDLGRLQISDHDEVQFINTIISPIKGVRFLVSKKDSFGKESRYIIFVHKRAHTFLLRRALLKKLGYNVPVMKRMARLKVRFNGVASKKNFLGLKVDEQECDASKQDCPTDDECIDDDSCGRDTTSLRVGAGGIERWVLNANDDNSNVIDLQDVIIMRADHRIYNLALLPGSAAIQRKRRLFNALLVVYNLVDVRESVNGFAYYGVRRWHNSLYFPLEDTHPFDTSIEDAKWIAKRIAKLSPKDIQEIVAAADYPKPVAMLLEQKLLGRQKDLMRALDIEFDAPSINSKVSFGKHLVNGKLIKTEWEGYGSYFSYGEAASLISGPEVRSYLKWKGLSSLIQEAMIWVNDEWVPKTDLNKKIFESQKKVLLDHVVDSLISGESKKLPFGYFTHPFFAGNLILSREVVTGSYLGTENTVQLADTFGFSLDAGVFIGTYGLPDGVSSSATIKGSWRRTFSHLKPLRSIQAVDKEPFRNMIVTSLKSDYASVLDYLNSAHYKGLNQIEKEEKLSEVVAAFKDGLGDGEALIISDSIGPAADLGVGYAFDKRVSAQAKLIASQTYLWRLHITRQGNTLHVYKDNGDLTSFGFSISLDAQIQIISANKKIGFGEATMLHYQLNLDTDLQQNPNLEDQLLAFKDVLSTSEVDSLNEVQSPTKISHDFKEGQFNFKFLFWRYATVNSTDEFNVFFKDEPEVKVPYVRHVLGKRSGQDLQGLTIEVADYLIKKHSDAKGGIVNSGNGDPGNGLFGESYARNVYFESELYREGSKKELVEPFSHVVKRWKGWSTSREEVLDIIEEMKEQYNFVMYPEEVLHLTEELQLYSIFLTINFYEEAIDNMSQLSRYQLIDLLYRYGIKNFTANANQNYGEEYDPFLNEFTRHQYNYLRYRKKGKVKKASEYGAEMVSALEEHLNYKGLLLAVGGESNIRIFSHIDGFKKGADGETASKERVFSNDLGQAGSRDADGPLNALRRELNISESELFLYWILRKL